jgi:hypothetical protein
MEDAAEVGGQVESSQVGSTLGGGGVGGVPGAVEVQEEHLPGGVGLVRVVLEGDVLVAEIAMEQAGVVEGAGGPGHALEQGHEGGAAGGFGVDALEFVAETGQAGHKGGHQAAVVEAGALPAFDHGNGRGGFDAGPAQDERVAEGAFGFRAAVPGEAVAPGGLGAIGFDDRVEGGIAIGEQEAVHPVAAGAHQRGGIALHQMGELQEALDQVGPVAARSHQDAPRAARLPGRIIHKG